MTVAAASVRRLDREAMQRFLPLLDEWLLPSAFFGVQHTWPQLYRRDGEGLFFGLFEDDRLLSHCACRLVTLHEVEGPRRACLLGSVATDPRRRGEGLAGRVLAAALAATATQADCTLLWAERTELYARHGFVAGAEETGLVLVRRPRGDPSGVRLAEVPDHAALHALHQQKPLRVERSAGVMSGLLTTPGLTTVVLERGGGIVAYACTGKGADLQGHWHEVGGRDEDVAQLLPAAMHVADQIDAVLLLPPYRALLRSLLGPNVVAELTLPGPMVRALRQRPPQGFIDGLDSV